MYWGLNTTPPNNQPEGAEMAANSDSHSHTAPLSVDSMITAIENTLPEHAAEDLADHKTRLATVDTDSAKYNIFKAIGDLLLEHKQFVAAIYYYTEGAKLDNSEKSLNFAGRFNLELMRNAPTLQVKEWATQNAISSFERSLEINPDNDTVKMALASAYVDGTGQPMQGIQILLGITRKDPDNVPANLMLGQLSMRSGQTDKAISRFETVLKIEPENTEAMLPLAEAYKNKGNKQKAIELFEKSKVIIDNPQFSSDIDEYINSFK